MKNFNGKGSSIAGVTGKMTPENKNVRDASLTWDYIDIQVPYVLSCGVTYCTALYCLTLLFSSFSPSCPFSPFSLSFSVLLSLLLSLSLSLSFFLPL